MALSHTWFSKVVKYSPSEVGQWRKMLTEIEEKLLYIHKDKDCIVFFWYADSYEFFISKIAEDEGANSNDKSIGIIHSKIPKMFA